MRAPGEWLTVEEAARRFGIHRSTVNVAIRLGKIAWVKEGRTLWVQGWRAAELWEYKLLRAQGLRRCVKCLEIKSIDEFPRGTKDSHRSTCKDCWRPIATKWMNQYRKRPAVQKRLKAWYAERGGISMYRKTRRMARKLVQIGVEP